jgi:hypothetical protein
MPGAMRKPRNISITLVIFKMGTQQREFGSVTAWLTSSVSSAQWHDGKRILILQGHRAKSLSFILPSVRICVAGG